MATRTLSEHKQRWVVIPTEDGTYRMLETANSGDEAEGLAFWRTHGYPTAVLATVKITTTIETDDA